MTSYLDAITGRKDRTTFAFSLYNQRRFDELLAFYSDDVIAFMPELLEGTTPDMRYAHGKAEYTGLLARFREIYGTVTVKSVFAVGRETNIQIEDEKGNFGAVSIELTEEGLIRRIFFLHRARREADALAA